MVESSRDGRPQQLCIAPDHAVADILILAEVYFEREALDTADVQFQRLRFLIPAGVGVFEESFAVAQHGHRCSAERAAGLLESELGLKLLERAAKLVFQHASRMHRHAALARAVA